MGNDVDAVWLGGSAANSEFSSLNNFHTFAVVVTRAGSVAARRDLAEGLLVSSAIWGPRCVAIDLIDRWLNPDTTPTLA
jgi:hypothetical protein